MKTRLFLLLVLLMLNSSIVQAASIAFAPLPMENRETIVKQVAPMMSFLKDKTGFDFHFEYSDSYAELLRKFQQGVIDLAYLGPLPYVTLKEMAPQAHPLVFFNEASGEPLYTCSIVALGDSDIDLGQARNMKVALTQPLSTCGFLSTNGLLRKAGSSLAENWYRYLNKHDEVALAVVRGDFDFGGVKTAIGKKYKHLGLVSLAETDPMPSFALVANSRTLAPDVMEAIGNALLRLDAQGADKDMMADWGSNVRNGVVPAADSYYDVVRGLLGREPIPDEGNF